ncbi:MAG: hypothetical protein GQ581_09950, partial [Methyloprofundus sp.]|nr:hypothetical protein [Methyloprofundus sp.]
ADELSASSGFSNNVQESSLYLGINLTENGLGHIDDVIDIVFQYIRILQNSDVQEWLFREQQQMAQLQFRYQEKHNASSTVTGLAHNLQYYATTDVLRAPYIMEQYKPALIQQLISQLTPARVLIALSTKDVNTNKTEANYQVDYTIDKITPELIQRWSSSSISPELKLPTPNPFIPTQLALKADDNAQKHPELINQVENITLWHQLDTSFNVPRSNLFIALHSPIANSSPRNSILTSLFAGMLKKQLNSYAYPAHLAGLNYSIYPTERGLSISLSGYDQQQPVLLERIISAINAPEITADRFAILKDRYQQKLNNAQKQQPFQQVLAELKRSLVERHWTNAQKLTALTTITRQDLATHAKALLQQLQVTLLQQGNTTDIEAQQIANFIKQQLAVKPTQINVPAAKVIQLPENSLSSRKLTIDNQDAALALYFQAPNKSIQAQAEAQLLGRIIATAFFADLRTQQQLGYNLGAAGMPIKDVPGMIFILQSPIISAPEIEKRFQAFINSYLAQLENISIADFDAYKSGLMTRLLEKDKSLSKRSYRNWLEIDRENQKFDTREQIAAAVNNIDKAQLISVYKDWLMAAPRQFRSYALGTQFSQDDFSDLNPIIDTDTFKQEHNKL